MEDSKDSPEGFNEQELADIMDEIETLEDHQPEESAVISQLAEVDIDETILSHEPKAEVHHLDERPTSPCVMNFNLEGQANINIGFDVQGQHISLSLDEDFVSITLGNGSEFKVPLKQQDKKAS